MAEYVSDKEPRLAYDPQGHKCPDLGTPEHEALRSETRRLEIYEPLRFLEKREPNE